jgi:hypothetical protein
VLFKQIGPAEYASVDNATRTSRRVATVAAIAKLPKATITSPSYVAPASSAIADVVTIGKPRKLGLTALARFCILLPAAVIMIALSADAGALLEQDHPVFGLRILRRRRHQVLQAGRVDFSQCIVNFRREGKTDPRASLSPNPGRQFFYAFTP